MLYAFIENECVYLKQMFTSHTETKKKKKETLYICI